MDVKYIENPPIPAEPLENQIQILKLQNQRQAETIAELRSQVNGLGAQLSALNSRPDPITLARLSEAQGANENLKKDLHDWQRIASELKTTQRHQTELIKLQAECLLALKNSTAFAISVADSYRPHDD